MEMVSCLNKLIKSNGTKFTVPEGLLLALIGFLIVVTVLFVLMGCIYGLSALVKKLENIKKGATNTQVVDSVVETAPGSSGSVKLNNVDERTAAMCMAIVADELGTPINELRFISIKEVSEDNK